MKRLIRTCAFALLMALTAGSSWAQTFPDRAITIYCAFPAGASADTALRALARQVQPAPAVR
jgi:tripartite-type tricarboxylate transporter receptor subunit TctC